MAPTAAAGTAPTPQKGHVPRSAGSKYEKKKAVKEKKRRGDDDIDTNKAKDKDKDKDSPVTAGDRLQNPKVRRARLEGLALALHASPPTRRHGFALPRAALRTSQAFAFQSGRHALKVKQRNIDREQKRLHVPLPDRSQEEPPPVMVAVVGPSKVGPAASPRNSHVDFC